MIKNWASEVNPEKKRQDDSGLTDAFTVHYSKNWSGKVFVGVIRRVNRRVYTTAIIGPDSSKNWSGPDNFFKKQAPMAP